MLSDMELIDNNFKLRIPYVGGVLYLELSQGAHYACFHIIYWFPPNVCLGNIDYLQIRHGFVNWFLHKNSVHIKLTALQWEVSNSGHEIIHIIYAVHLFNLIDPPYIYSLWIHNHMSEIVEIR